MNLKYCKNIAPDTYEILLIGEIGEEIKGREVAREIMYLNSIGAKVIKERINTVGGTIMDAYSIVSSNIFSEAEIHTINEGVADSAGSFILASGMKGKRECYDYATMLVHNPSLDGIMLEDLPEGRDKDEMLMFRNSIVTILSNNSGKTQSDIINMMKESKRLNAKDALNFGFIDSIKTSVNNPAIVENMSVLEIMNVCKDFHNNNTKDKFKIDNNMKTVLNVLNLSEDASEASAVSAVKAITNKAELAEGKSESLAKDVQNLNDVVAEKETVIAEKDAKIVELETIVNESKVAAIKNVVDSAIKSGKFTEENRDPLTKQATALGVENFTEMVDMIKLPVANAVALVQNSSKEVKNSTDEDLAKEYQKLASEDPIALKELKNSNPTQFDKMFNAWDKA